MSKLKLDSLSDDEVLKLLDITVAGIKERKRTSFDDLQERIQFAKYEFMLDGRRNPKTLFLGFAEMDTLKQIPPWQLVRDPKCVNLGEQVMGLEVIRVIKDTFLQVA